MSGGSASSRGQVPTGKTGTERLYLFRFPCSFRLRSVVVSRGLGTSFRVVQGPGVGGSPLLPLLLSGSSEAGTLHGGAHLESFSQHQQLVLYPRRGSFLPSCERSVTPERAWNASDAVPAFVRTWSKDTREPREENSVPQSWSRRATCD